MPKGGVLVQKQVGLEVLSEGTGSYECRYIVPTRNGEKVIELEVDKRYEPESDRYEGRDDVYVSTYYHRRGNGRKELRNETLIVGDNGRPAKEIALEIAGKHEKTTIADRLLRR
jgi:hypothetical protein